MVLLALLYTYLTAPPLSPGGLARGQNPLRHWEASADWGKEFTEYLSLLHICSHQFSLFIPILFTLLGLSFLTYVLTQSLLVILHILWQVLLHLCLSFSDLVPTHPNYGFSYPNIWVFEEENWKLKILSFQFLCKIKSFKHFLWRKWTGWRLAMLYSILHIKLSRASRSSPYIVLTVWGGRDEGIKSAIHMIIWYFCLWAQNSLV